MTELPPIPLVLRTRLAHATLQAIADECGADVLHIKGPSVDASLLPVRQDAPTDASPEERALPRVSADADVLVRPAHLKRFLAALKRHGWQRKTRLYSGGAVEHSLDYWHPELGGADIHIRFPGIQLTRERAFDELWTQRYTLELAHRPCQVPSLDAQRLLMLLHAARSGGPSSEDVGTFWGNARTEERERLRTQARRMCAEVAVAAAIGSLGEYTGRRDYPLWRAASSPSPDAFEVWLAHMRAATTRLDRARILLYPFRLKKDRLEVTLQRRVSSVEALLNHLSRARRGASGFRRIASRAGRAVIHGRSRTCAARGDRSST